MKGKGFEHYLHLTTPSDLFIQDDKFVDIEEANQFILIEGFNVKLCRHFTCPAKVFAIFAHNKDFEYN